PFACSATHPTPSPTLSLHDALPIFDPCRTGRPTMDVNVAIGGWGWFSGDMMHDAAPSADRSDPAALLAEGRAHLGLELGSTRIKAALIDDGGTVLGTGSHAWENQLVDDSWTYSLDDALTGVQGCYADLVRDVRERHGVELTQLASLGISGMMHG